MRTPMGGTSASDNRDLIRTALDETVFVEAAAGTGKTTELVGRVVRLIETRRARIGELAALTFSEKAAGELKLRLREELERARASHPPAAPESALLAAAIHEFEDAHVSTIHGFCAELLRERPVEARVDPAFEVLTEGQAAALLDEAFDAWIQRALERPGEGVRRSLRRPSRWADLDEAPGGPIERLRKAARELGEWRDHPAPWRRPRYDRPAALRALAAELQAFAELTARPLKRGDVFHLDTAAARRTHDEIARLLRSTEERADEPWDSCEAALVALAEDRDFARPRKGSGAAFASGVARAAAHEAHAALLQSLQRFKQAADADLAARLRDELGDCLALYEQRKRETGALDYLDLLIKARDLVRDHRDVRRRLQARFRAVLVDEFQDTDPLQAELLLLIASDEHGRLRPGALFIVGDPKQSIYRFRRADVGAYMRLTERLPDEGARRVTLQQSFRSGPALQRFVNAAFAPEMTGDPRALQAAYVALGPHREDMPQQPSIIALPVPRPYGRTSRVTQAALEASQPGAVAEFIRWLVSADCAWRVEVPDPADATRRVRRPIRPSDVCILFRRFAGWTQDVTRPYLEALEARGIPHLLVGGRSFHEREEVDVIRVALTAVEWPEDELSVYATLHGPLFAIGEEELFEYHARAGVFHPFRIPADVPDRLRPLAEALGLLRDLHAERNLRPVADTIGRLLAATRAHAGFVLWRGGEQVLANVLHIVELGRRYEAEGGISFRGFVEQLREAARRADAPEAPILEEGSEGVRLMTVHKAKGLEFPVVVLADIGCRLSRAQASRHLDTARGLCAVRIGGWAPLDLLDHNAEEAARDEAEGVRLAYVAATRARDLLVVAAVGDEPYAGWLRPLNRALYPPVDRRHSPRPARGVPLFKGKDTVLERPDGRQPDEHTVRPGAYELVDPGSGKPYTVVWWDPLLLEGAGDAPRGLRREELISKEADPAAVAADRARYEAWKHRRAAALAEGSRPSVSVLTATAWAHGLAAGAGAHVAGPVPFIDAVDPGAVHVDGVELAGARPAGRRFGILVHALLAVVPFDAGADLIGRLAAVHARVLGATDEERSAAASVVERALKHRVFDEARAARAAGRACRREAPVSITVAAPAAPAAPGSSFLIDGQIDLAYDTENGWVVVDFKTDAEIAGAEEAYRRQVALYAHAVARATGRPARGVLLRI